MSVGKVRTVAFFITLQAYGWAGAQTTSSSIGTGEISTLLIKATSTSNLETSTTPAFHLSSTFETFDYKGQQDGSGTIEEYWDGTSRIRRLVTYRGATQVTVIDREESVSSEPFESSLGLRSLTQGLLKPLSLDPNQSNLLMEGKKVKLGGVDADCIAVAFKPPSSPNGKTEAFTMPENHDTYCLAGDRHILRLVNTSSGMTFIFNNLEGFGSKPVPHEITLKRAEVVRGKVHIKSITAWSADDATFIPPPQSVSYPRSPVSGMPGRVLAGTRTSGDDPKFPLSAKVLRVSGQVVLSAIISRTGVLKDIEVVSSPTADFAKAAVDSAKTWKYRPFLLNDQPVEVDTTIYVSFRQ